MYNVFVNAMWRHVHGGPLCIFSLRYWSPFIHVYDQIGGKAQCFPNCLSIRKLILLLPSSSIAQSVCERAFRQSGERGFLRRPGSNPGLTRGRRLVPLRFEITPLCQHTIEIKMTTNIYILFLHKLTCVVRSAFQSPQAAIEIRAFEDWLRWKRKKFHKGMYYVVEHLIFPERHILFCFRKWFIKQRQWWLYRCFTPEIRIYTQ